MGAEKSTGAAMRRLHLALSGAWACAWILGTAALSAVAIGLNDKLRWQDLDAELELYATATYGLTWFDETGTFHDELLVQERDIDGGPVDIWVVEPGQPARFHLEPTRPRFRPSGLAQVAEEVVRTNTDFAFDGRDSDSLAFRAFAIPTYADDAGDIAKAAIVVIGDPRPGARAHEAFTTRLLLISVGIGALGLVVGMVMARWSLRPVASTLEQRERFLAATAHELRTPVASLRAVTESAFAGDEAADVALRRVDSLARRTGDVVDDLLLFAQLDAWGAALERTSVRLDLLVEACLPEGAAIDLEGETTVAEVDPRLVRVAVRNLADNALRHANQPESRVRVSVTGTSVVVEDSGPGFPGEVLELAQGAFSAAPSHHGAGLGLATAKMIARLHGGELQLENPPTGGARATLRLG